MTQFYADRFDADGTYLVFDEAKAGEEVAGPFDSLKEAEREATRLSGIAEYEERLLSGKAFALAEMSHRGRWGYRPPISNRDWAFCMSVFADMARQSDALAQIASAIFGRVNLYGTDGQCSAAVYSAAAGALRNGYTDYVGLAGPEPGRRSDRQRDFTLRERVILMHYIDDAIQPWSGSAPGHGWCLTALAKEVGYTHHTRSR